MRRRLFFGRALGRRSVSQTAEATAAFWCSFRGFQIPSDGSNLGFLPLAMDEQSWDELVAQWKSKRGPDAYRWNEATKSLTAGKDGIPEANLYPQGTGSPGNRGTVDVGSSNNSTADLVRQITQGVSQADLDYIGGKLELNSQGMLLLNGDTGISAAIKSALDQIKGKPRIIPIFSTVTGNGNNAMYTIVGFGGIRIMDVKLTGSMSSKKVTIQPSGVQIDGGIPYTGGSQSPTLFIYSPVVLVR